jgi:site-specific recombinase XerD
MMMNTVLANNYPINYPIKMSGKLTYKVKIKKDYIRTDGTCAIYIQCFLNSEKKIFPLDISVKKIEFDDKKQRVNSKCFYQKDFNLLIEKRLAQINKIEINYRLSSRNLTIEKLTTELENPTSWVDFCQFWNDELELEKGVIKQGTYRQQKSNLKKLKEFKEVIYFNDLNEELYISILKWLKVKKKNEKNTINTFSKNFKKFLNKAIKKGIQVQLDVDCIKVSSFKGDRTFLEALELKKLFKYYNSEFINPVYKNTIAHFLFSCFTGLRYSDVNQLSNENIIADYIVFVAEKTNKLQRISLNDSSKLFLNEVLNKKHSNEHFNRILKEVCKIAGITKRVTFHVARHTFATNFLISGGRVEVLQKILGHSKIEDTMIYVHIVDSITNEQIFKMDEILNS